jgi:hypothetical protein
MAVQKKSQRNKTRKHGGLSKFRNQLQEVLEEAKQKVGCSSGTKNKTRSFLARDSETEEEQIESPENELSHTGFEMPSTYDLPENYVEEWRSRKFREEEEPENTSQEFEFRLRNKSSSSNSEDDQASTNPKL